MATLQGVDRRLLDIVDRVRRDWAARGYRIEYTPVGGRDRRPGGTPHHPAGRALDVSIWDRDGRLLDNLNNASTFRTYEKYAQDARRIQQRDYPELDRDFRWGGYFRQGVPFDQMHLDISGGGMAYGNWAEGLNADGKRALPGAVSFGIGQEEPAAKEAGFGVTQTGLNLGNLSRSEVKSLQSRLNAGGFIGEDGQPLTVDGIAGPNTEAAVTAALTQASSLSANAPEDQVRAVQSALNAAGVTDAKGNPLTEDGRLGPNTQSAMAKVAGFGVAPIQQSRLSPLDQLARSAVPAPPPSASMMSMAPAVRPSLYAGVSPQTSAAASTAGPPLGGAGQFSPKPSIGLSASGAPRVSVNPSVSGSFAPTPSVARPETFGQAVPSSPDPRGSGLYAPTPAANPRIAGAYDSLKGQSSLHLASDLARKAQGLPATPPQSPFAGSPERPSVRAAQGVGFPASRGMGTAPLPSSMSPGPVQPRGPLQIGALVQDMREAPKPASFRSPMDLNPGMAALDPGMAPSPADPRIAQGFSAIPDTDLELFSATSRKARGRTVPVTSGAAISPTPQSAASGMMTPRAKVSVQTSGSALRPAVAPPARGMFAPQVRPGVQLSGTAAPAQANPMASGTFAPQVRPALQTSGTVAPVQPNPTASASFSPRPAYNPLSSIKAPARSLPSVTGSISAPPAMRPGISPISYTPPPQPTSSAVTAPMSIPSGTLPPLDQPVTIGLRPVATVPAVRTPAPVAPSVVPSAVPFAAPTLRQPAPTPGLLPSLLNQAKTFIGNIPQAIGKVFDVSGPTPVDRAMQAAMAGGAFNARDFWDSYNSLPGIGSGGGSLGLQGMANYAAAKASGMGEALPGLFGGGRSSGGGSGGSNKVGTASRSSGSGGSRQTLDKTKSSSRSSGRKK